MQMGTNHVKNELAYSDRLNLGPDRLICRWPLTMLKRACLFCVNYVWAKTAPMPNVAKNIRFCSVNANREADVNWKADTTTLLCCRGESSKNTNLN